MDSALFLYTESSGYPEIDGSFTVEESKYIIDNCGEGCHVLIKLGAERLNSQPEPELEPDLRGKLNMFGSEVLNVEPQFPPIVSIMVYYTAEFEHQFSNPLMTIKSYVAATNDAFKKSGLDEVKLKLHCIEKIAIMDSDSDSGEARLDSFDVAKGTTSALLNSADIALLLTRSGVSRFEFGVVIN